MRVCVVSGSFLVSVFSSLLFLCFFLIRESLLYFITTSVAPPAFSAVMNGDYESGKDVRSVFVKSTSVISWLWAFNSC